MKVNNSQRYSYDLFKLDNLASRSASASLTPPSAPKAAGFAFAAGFKLPLAVGRSEILEKVYEGKSCDLKQAF